VRLTNNCGPHVEKITANAIAGAHEFARDHVVLWHQRFGIAAEIDIDIAALDPFDDTHHELTDPIGIRFDYLRALRLAHFLHDDLLGRLCGDSAELGSFQGFLDIVATAQARVALAGFREPDLARGMRQFPLRNHRCGGERLFVIFSSRIGLHYHVRIDDRPPTKRVVFARISIDRDPALDVIVEALSGCAAKCRFERLEDDLLGHALLVRHDLDDRQYFFVHQFFTLVFRSQLGIR